MQDCAIIGAGPAGLSAAIYAGAEGLSARCFGDRLGGSAGGTSRIENFIGFPKGLSGPAFASRAKRQAERMGCPIVADRLCHIEPEGDEFRLSFLSGRDEKAKSVIIATGARYNRLPVETDSRRWETGRGVHYACTSREVGGHKPLDAVVIGGANSAGQAAVYLAQFRPTVHLIIRGDGLGATMSRYLVDRIKRAPNIVIHCHSEVKRLCGDSHVRLAAWQHSISGEMTVRQIADAYVMIGAVPHTDFLSDLVDRDPHGFIMTDGNRMTTRPGLFAAGDVRDGSVKRVATAVGEGAIAIASVYKYLNGRMA